MFYMQGEAPRETARILESLGDVKVKIGGQTSIVRARLLDDDRHAVYARQVADTDDEAQHMPQADAEVQAIVDGIEWGQPTEVLTSWNSETPR